jgi:hypothetical protein
MALNFFLYAAVSIVGTTALSATFSIFETAVLVFNDGSDCALEQDEKVNPVTSNANMRMTDFL